VPKNKIAVIFRTKTRDQWCEIMEGTDACFTPVLSLDEAPKHPHNVARKSFIEVDGLLQPGPAPRFSRTSPEIQTPPPIRGDQTKSVLSDWDFSEDKIEALKTADAI
jgi:alpha-methylacyl-CoA racemase